MTYIYGFAYMNKSCRPTPTRCFLKLWNLLACSAIWSISS